ncbi:MAG: 3-hydroxyacyl-ACP dehydratase FabZ [Alphaproteobacteria bacterium]|nr:3-hydroxyacyl-ACP dehydratase FabZ [Alphaproteobacteria bacterium]
MNDAVATGELASADIRRIMELLPHRPPFLLIDRVIDMQADARSATGVKNVTINEPQFAGHFPGLPVMPGVLLIEAMAQTAGALVVHTQNMSAEGKVVYFMTIDKARFRSPVQPGDTVMLPVKLLRRRGPVWRFSGEARVNDRLCAEAEFSAMIMDTGGKEPTPADE